MQNSWSPYVAGAGIGILGCFALILSDHPLGVATGFIKIQGLLDRTFRRRVMETNEYYKIIPPAIDWQLMIVPGIIIGAFIAAMLSHSVDFNWIPIVWGKTFGFNPFLRIIIAIIGGILLEFGARWAGGCTVGHGISGVMQLSLASFVATVCFFIGGIGMAFFLFKFVGV
ncbi:MAG: YeeE/YedE thiosulfate transporter family protein [Methanoregulaceae archaeon]|jgi:uncharacterized membrane protein YedE/YeeE